MITQSPERRARNVTLAGAVFELALVVVFTLLTLWSQSEALRGLTLLSASGLLTWVFLILVYHQRALVVDEEFETEQLRLERAAGREAIFDVEGEQLLLARRRLQWMYRWMLPGFTLVVIAVLLIAAQAGWPWQLGQSVTAEGWKDIQNASMVTWFVGGAAFLSFLFSRYVTGMARQAEWQMLRAGASYLMGITLAAAGLTFALGALHFFQTPVPERVLAYALRILLFVLAGEFGLNFVLDLYRPRAPGEAPRPAFDSRLLGLFSEPGGLARSIAEAINYQFGFEVSSTWFYKLMERAVVPLIGFGVATLFAASCLVFVDADSKVVIERFGRKVAVLEPGLHSKWFWPIDVAYKVPTELVHELKIGEFTDQEKLEQQRREKQDGQPELILWTNQHATDPHLQVLVATPKLAKYLTPAAPEVPAEQRSGVRGFAKGGQAVPVSLLRVAVTIQYEIRDAYQWLTTYEDPERMLKAIAEREIVRYCASVDVANLLGTKRGPIEQALWEAVQKEAKARMVGVNIKFLGLQGVHPPVETAEEFQSVVGAEQKKLAAIHSAESNRDKRLTEMAGDVGRARQLAGGIRALNTLEAKSSTPAGELESARQRVQQLFFGDAAAGITPVGGKAAGRITGARALRWKLENEAHARAVVFVEQAVAKAAAPRVYLLRELLKVYAEGLPGIRKYVIAAQGKWEAPTFHLNLQDPMSAPLDLKLEENK